jgi:ABC-type glutathione transport system ATPase component
MRQNKSIVIVISHRPSALAALDMAMVLYEGKAIAFGSCQEIFARVSGGMSGQAAPAIGKAAPAIGKAAPTIGKAAPTIGKAAPTIGKAAPAVGKAAPQPQQVRAAAPAAPARTIRRAAPAAENA